MVEEGTFRVDFSRDEEGNWTAAVSFHTSEGAGGSPLGEPVAITEGAWLEIGPAGLIFDPVTSVTSGTGTRSGTPSSRAPAPGQRPSTPTPPKPGQQPTPGPSPHTSKR
jgi:hypothetical protein